MEAGFPASQAWGHALAGWGVPQEILDQAPQSPWIMPPALFRVPDGAGPTDSPSHRRARAALPAGGSVLDVGCGGGRAALGLTPPAGRLIGVDERPAMLRAFAEAAAARGVVHQEVDGRWPDVAERTPEADVVVCHHVAYNVGDLRPFALALQSRARRRVVLELSWQHPLAYLSPLWERFWGLARPHGPTADDALHVLREAGLPARLDLWDDPSAHREAGLPLAEQVEIVRIRLCLAADRDIEIADALGELPPRSPRPTATIWWDAGGDAAGVDFDNR
jgi:SAM-dependent methyltransferase